MHTLLTGGTGLIGSAVLRDLVADGQRVTALVRSDASAETVRAAGAEPLVGRLTDVAWLTGTLQSVDGAIHLASPGDDTSPDVDRAVVDAVVAAFAGTGKPYVHTGGIWSYGEGSDLSETDPQDPPRLTAWRGAVERAVLAADVVATVVEPGVVHGHGGGIPAILVGSVDETGAVRLVGDGEQHWPTVHVDDVAALYLRVLTSGTGHGHLIASSGSNPTVRELGEAVAGATGVRPETDEVTLERLGLFGEALLLDQQASGAKARSLGWTPSGPTLLEELETGSYAG